MGRSIIMKLATVVLSALALLLFVQQSQQVSLYETYIQQHGWKIGHYVGACVLAAYRKYPAFGTNAWAGVCTCHTRSVQVSTPGGVNLGPYMRNLVTCCLTSSIPGVAVIGAEIVHCTAGKVNAFVNSGR